MPLTNQQIETLFEFTRKKFVPYYDLQLELVDHLASSIEEEMSQHPAISFEQALEKVYARFGIFGFAHVVQEKQAALEKQYRKLWQQILRTYFTIPKIAFTAALFCSVLYIVPLLKNNLQMPVIYILIGCSVIRIRLILANKNTSKKPLLLTQFAPSSYILSCFVLPVFLGVFEWNTNRGPVIFAAFITYTVIVQAALIQVYKQIRKKAMQLYPEAFATT